MEPVINSALVICQRNAAAARARLPIADPAPDHFRDAIAERLHTALIFVECKPEWFRKDFTEYLRNNFHVYLAFEREANKIWDSGRRDYSHRTIWEFLRHQTATREVPNELEFKLNDHYTKDCARLYTCFHQDRADFFEFRNGQSAVRSQ